MHKLQRSGVHFAFIGGGGGESVIGRREIYIKDTKYLYILWSSIIGGRVPPGVRHCFNGVSLY